MLLFKVVSQIVNRMWLRSLSPLHKQINKNNNGYRFSKSPQTFVHCVLYYLSYKAENNIDL